MRVLVTGLSGFTGAYLRQELENHANEVVGLKANLTDWAAVASEVLSVQPDAVIHLAAISYVPDGDSLDVYAVNTLGAQGLLEALLKLSKPLQKVILASSSNVYGMREGVLDETMCPQPVNHYGCSKLAMEHIAMTYAERLPIVITRPFNYTGIGQSEKFLIPKIVSHFRQRLPVIELGNIDVSRDFSDVRWVAAAYRALLESPQTAGEYNLCSGEMLSINQILQMLEQASGHRIEVQVNPDFVRANDIMQQCGSAGRIKSLMPHDNAAVNNFSETLKWMLAG
jgi:nucleoside-diphosphate-sugar epimerase